MFQFFDGKSIINLPIIMNLSDYFISSLLLISFIDI